MSVYSKNGFELGATFAPSGVGLSSAFDADGVQVFSTSHTIKVMTYNVGSWYDGNHDNVPADKDADYYALQKGILLQNNADIVFMNEYTQRFSKTGRTAISLLRECGYQYIVETDGGTDTEVTGRCIASKYPLSDYTKRTFDDGSNRYYDSCIVSVGGIRVNLVITHLHWDNRTLRTSEMATIMSLLSGFDKFILAGDFNTTDNYDTTGADYINIIKPLIDAGYNVANAGDFGFIVTYYDEPDSTWHGVLDNIVTSANIEIESVYVDETKLNDNLTERIDHIPLIATLQI